MSSRFWRRAKMLVRFSRDIVLVRPQYAHLAPAFWGLALSAAGALSYSGPIGAWLAPSILLLALLSAIMAFDARYFIIPDNLNGALGFVGLASFLTLDAAAVPEHLAGALAAYAVARGVNLVYRTLRGVDGLGQGDAKLLAAAGCWLPWEALASALLYAVVSALISVALLARSGTHIRGRTPLPFGLHIALGVWLTWVLGPLEFGSSF
jgi:leader peptidase (prepilin peptidase) / N-methyltransferase